MAKQRDYDRETELSKKRYESFSARIDKKLGLRFKKELEDKNIKYANWLTARITEFLEKK